MEVILFVIDEMGMWCIGFGIIDECLFKGVWCGYFVFYSFFVIVNFISVNFEYRGYIVYCEELFVFILGDVENYRVLWSGYKVWFIELFGLFIGYVVEGGDIGGLLIVMFYFVFNKLKDEICSLMVMEEGLVNWLDVIGEGC